MNNNIIMETNIIKPKTILKTTSGAIETGLMMLFDKVLN